MRTLRVGQAGAGGRGVPVRAAMLQCDRIKIDCILEPEARWVRRALEDGDFHVCASIEEMLARDIDAVVLTTPNHLHEPHTLAAAAAKKHVWVEKPIANRLGEAGRMIRACGEHNVKLAVGHSSRFNSLVKTTKRLVDEGVFGQLCGFQVATSHDNAKQSERKWKVDPKVTPDPGLFQLGIHQIDALLSFFGEVTSVFGRHQRTTDAYDMTDTTHTMMRFANGLVGTLSCYYLVPATRVWNFFGTKARMVAGRDGLELLGEDGKSETIPLESEHGGAVEMMAAFADSVLDGKSYPIDGEAGVRALAVAWASILSSELEREVTIEETSAHYRGD